MKKILTLMTLISLNAQAVIVNLDADIRVKEGTNGCSMEEKMMAAEFKFYEDPESGFADWVGLVVFKPKFRKPHLIPRGGFDLTKAKDIVFPVQEPDNCEFKTTLGKISGSDDDEIGLLFRGKGCKSIVDIFSQNQFSELGLEWSAITVGDGPDRLDGLTMTIYNPCKK